MAGNSNSKMLAIILIVLGLCFSPFIIGIPVAIYGFIQLFR